MTEIISQGWRSCPWALRLVGAGKVPVVFLRGALPPSWAQSSGQGARADSYPGYNSSTKKANFHIVMQSQSCLIAYSRTETWLSFNKQKVHYNVFFPTRESLASLHAEKSCHFEHFPPRFQDSWINFSGRAQGHVPASLPLYSGLRRI